jgi:nicotinate-nucleotide--dimethylbenzimidazole phosphoribosyltransferase
MVQNFLNGGATINVLARQQNADVLVLDIGVNHRFNPHPHLVDRKIASGTRNMAKETAMSRAEAEESITIGIQVPAQLAYSGVDLLATGEMGIGNTTASSAIFSVLGKLSVAEVTGRGTGIDDKTLSK